MDFVFRGFYKRSQNSSSTSQSSYFTQKPSQCKFESGEFLGDEDALIERQLEKERFREEILAKEAVIERQLEKERIRDEILAKEATRRELEEEVRRELRMEREFELRRRGGDQWEAPCYVESRLVHKRIALPSQERMYDIKQQKIGGFEKELPFQRAPRPIEIEPKSPASYVFKAKEKKQITLLAKPDTNHTGRKGKDRASLIECPSEGTKKEWSCALCQISATSERELEDHVMGKKHKSRHASNKISNPLEPSQVSETNVVSRKSQQTLSRVQTMPNNKKMKFKFFCEMCQVGAFSEQIWNDHNKGKRHLLSLEHGTKR